MHYIKNLETLSKLAAMERGHQFGDAGDHFKSLAGRLSYLQKKQLNSQTDHQGPSYHEAEIDALFWLLAQIQIDTGIDVKARLGGKKAGQGIDFKRYGEMLDHVRTCRARVAPRMLVA